MKTQKTDSAFVRNLHSIGLFLLVALFTACGGGAATEKKATVAMTNTAAKARPRPASP